MVVGVSCVGRACCLVVSVLFALTSCCKTSEIPDRIRDLSSGDAHERSVAALALGRCGPPEVNRAVPILINLLYDNNVGVQSAAAYALRRIDTPAARKALERTKKK